MVMLFRYIHKVLGVQGNLLRKLWKMTIQKIISTILREGGQKFEVNVLFAKEYKTEATRTSREGRQLQSSIRSRERFYQWQGRQDRRHFFPSISREEGLLQTVLPVVVREGRQKHYQS